jgi:LDH2 family malate/lactate/ureidoglycolate dehydrogenase
MKAKKPPVAQARQEFDIHARGAEYLNPSAWKASAQARIQMFAAIIIGTATGEAEKRQYGNATIALDPEAVAAITEAVRQVQKALTGSTAVWLPGTKEVQKRLPAARRDQPLQNFLKTLSDSTEKGTGTTDNAQVAPR